MARPWYVYICPDPACKSGEYKTTIPPHVFPRCMWCGQLLQPKPAGVK